MAKKRTFGSILKDASGVSGSSQSDVATFSGGIAGSDEQTARSEAQKLATATAATSAESAKSGELFVKKTGEINQLYATQLSEQEKAQLLQYEEAQASYSKMLVDIQDLYDAELAASRTLWKSDLATLQQAKSDLEAIQTAELAAATAKAAAERDRLAAAIQSAQSSQAAQLAAQQAEQTAIYDEWQAEATQTINEWTNPMTYGPPEGYVVTPDVGEGVPTLKTYAWVESRLNEMIRNNQAHEAKRFLAELKATWGYKGNYPDITQEQINASSAAATAERLAQQLAGH